MAQQQASAGTAGHQKLQHATGDDRQQQDHEGEPERHLAFGRACGHRQQDDVPRNWQGDPERLDEHDARRGSHAVRAEKSLQIHASRHTTAPKTGQITVQKVRFTFGEVNLPSSTLLRVTASTSRPGRSVPPRRVERDSMGQLEVPEGAYYGASTQRAVENFPISGERFDRRFIWALGTIKAAAARANRDLGILDARKAEAIADAADEVAGPPGAFDDQFVLDIFQTGSGTSTNTNANEVIAHRATELLGGTLAQGASLVHPNDDVNRGQSSNDVIPTAMHLSALAELREVLIPAVQRLREVLGEKSREFWPVVKTGRTHLQDATPIRLGQEFLGYVGQMDRALERLERASDELREV